MPSPIPQHTTTPVVQYTLPNGLHVVIQEDHRAPIVACYLAYKVGSAQEPPGSSGISHALEHLLGESSSKLSAGEASRVLHRLGAVENAMTTGDMTLYHQTLGSDRLEVALEIGADQMHTAQLSPEAFTREIEVIKAERTEGAEADTFAQADELLTRLSHPMSGYGTPTIGWRADLDRLTHDDLRQWYRQWYAPNNAVLVLVGDVQPEQARPLIERHFGPLAARPITPARQPLELATPGERRLYRLGNEARLLMNFNVPTYASAANRRTVTALRLAKCLLVTGLGSRLYTSLVYDDELLTSVYGGYGCYDRGDSLIRLWGRLNAATAPTLAQVESVMWTGIESLQRAAPTAAELERARNQLLAERVYELDSVSDQALFLALATVSNVPLTSLQAEREELLAITPEEVSAAAAQYLTRERACIAYLQPKEGNSHE